jgi:translocator protein
MKHTKRKIQTVIDGFYLFLWIMIFQGVGFFMGKITQINLNPWYSSLSKSILTPTDVTFAIIWPILYVFLAILGFKIFIKENLFSRKIKLIYGVQLLLNWLWTPIFFGLHWVGMALCILSVMLILTGMLTVELHHRKKKLTLLIAPYFIWIIFATYLNGTIWIN